MWVSSSILCSTAQYFPGRCLHGRRLSQSSFFYLSHPHCHCQNFKAQVGITSFRKSPPFFFLSARGILHVSKSPKHFIYTSDMRCDGLHYISKYLLLSPCANSGSSSLVPHWYQTWPVTSCGCEMECEKKWCVQELSVLLHAVLLPWGQRVLERAVSSVWVQKWWQQGAHPWWTITAEELLKVTDNLWLCYQSIVYCKRMYTAGLILYLKWSTFAYVSFLPIRILTSYRIYVGFIIEFITPITGSGTQ